MPRGWSASPAALATGRWREPGSGGRRRGGSGWAGACSAPSGASASGSSCSGPTGATTAPATAGSCQLASRLGVPCVATGNVHSHNHRRARLQDAFVAIGLGQTLEESEPRRRGNRSSALVSPGEMAARFAEHPEAVAETVRLAERLEFDLTTDLGYRHPRQGDRRRRPRAGRALRAAARRDATRAAPATPRPSPPRAKSWRRSASATSPASSSSTTSCWSWPGR